MYHSPILIGLYCLFFAFLSWHRLNWALAVLILALPAYLARSAIGFVPFTLLEAMIWIVFVVWFIKNVVLPKAGRSPAPDVVRGRWPILLLLLIAAIAIEISPDTIGALGIWKAYFVEPIMFFLVFINVIKNKKDLQLIVYALGVSALAISVFAIYQKFTGWAIPNEFWAAEATRRVTSFFGYPNAIGLYLGPIIILYFGRLFQQKKIWPIVFSLLVIITSLLSTIFAVSEGALVGILAGLIFFGLFFNKKSRLITIVGLIILIIIAASMPALWPELTFQGVSGKIRTEMWRETIQMLKDRPIFGAGLAGYQQTFDSYHQARHIEVYLYPNNIFLNFWSELGLAGLAIFGYLFYNFFSRGWQLLKNERTWALTLMAIMVTIIVHGLVDVPYFKNDLAVMFWLWL